MTADLRSQAEAAVERGEHDLAYRLFLEAIGALGSADCAPDAVDDTELHVLAAEDQHAQGRHAEAAALLRRALEERLALAQGLP